MQINGTVIKIEIDTSIAKKDGGSYEGCLLVYKDSKDGKIKDRAFHNATFKYNAGLRKSLESLKMDDPFVMEMEKKGDFWNVMSINKTEGKVNDTGANRQTGGTNSFDHKQDLIIRQNCVGNAIKFMELLGSQGNEGIYTITAVVDIAKRLEEYVNTGDLTVETEQDDLPF